MLFTHALGNKKYSFPMFCRLTEVFLSDKNVMIDSYFDGFDCIFPTKTIMDDYRGKFVRKYFQVKL